MWFEAQFAELCQHRLPVYNSMRMCYRVFVPDTYTQGMVPHFLVTRGLRSPNPLLVRRSAWHNVRKAFMLMFRCGMLVDTRSHPSCGKTLARQSARLKLFPFSNDDETPTAHINLFVCSFLLRCGACRRCWKPSHTTRCRANPRECGGRGR